MPTGRPASRPPGNRGTGRPARTTGRAGSRPGGRPVARRGQATPGDSGAAAVRRPRFTSRAAVLVLVLAVLMVSYASSMRAFLQQREQLRSLRADIAESQVNIKSLEREQARWADPAYVRAQARERFGWVPPGSIALQVLDENGKPMGADTSLSDETPGTVHQKPEWYQDAWGSMVAAGLPDEQKKPPPPAAQIRPPKTKQ